MHQLEFTQCLFDVLVIKQKLKGVLIFVNAKTVWPGKVSLGANREI